ncbi:hypothetical protein ACVILK_000356 [Bradyrhizobium embrapense]
MTNVLSKRDRGGVSIALGQKSQSSSPNVAIQLREIQATITLGTAPYMSKWR